MIEFNNITKVFGNNTVLQDVSFSVSDSSIYGLVGFNGSGKTTLLKTAAGIYKPDKGSVLFDGINTYDSDKGRSELFFMPDDIFFLRGATAESMGRFYKQIYKKFDWDLFLKISNIFGFDTQKKLRSFSKGMLKQAEIAFAIASKSRFLLLDEVFDGLDPQKKEFFRQILLEYIIESSCSVIVSSHSIADLGGFCDRIGLLNGKSIAFDCVVDDVPLYNKKYRILLAEHLKEETLTCLPANNLKLHGNALSFDVIGEKNLKTIEAFLSTLNLVSVDVTPMTIEEIFLSETEDKSDEIRKLFG